MIFIYLIDIDETLKLSQGQCHKVKVTYAFLYIYYFGYKSWTDRWILMILTYVIDIDETVKLTQGQGHKVKGQGHICINVKILFRL